jgi:hypothetical protein
MQSEETAMSRYTITVTRTLSRHVDPDAVIGYDRPLQTFFLQAFPDEAGEQLDLWLGVEYRAFACLSDLRRAAVAIGFDFVPISSGILRKLQDDHAREAIHLRSDPTIQELLGRAQA